MENNLTIVLGIDNVSINSWNDLIERSNYNTVFQSHCMYEFWENENGCDPLILGVHDENNVLVCLCLIVIISNGNGLMKQLTKRAIIYGGPVIDNEADGAKTVSFLLGNMNDILKRKSIYVEFRNSFDYSFLKNLFRNEKWNYIPYQNYKIELKDNDSVFGRFSSEKRRQIRKSLREGAIISYDKNEDDLVSIHNILINIYKNKVKKPLPSLSFFKGLMKVENAGISSIKYEGKVIGGAIFVYDGTCIYDWYRGGEDVEYKKQFPSTLAAWSVIEYGLLNKIPMFDFMGAGIKGESYGVQKFKSQFGGTLVEHGRFIKINNNGIYRLGKLALGLREKLV